MVDKTSPYRSGDFLTPLTDDWTKQSLVYVIADAGRLAFIRSQGEDEEQIPELANLEEPDPTTVFVKPRRGSNDRKRFEELKDLVTHWLGDVGKGQSLRKVREHLVNQGQFEPVFVENCLRMLVAQKTLVAFMDREKVHLRLSAQERQAEDRRNYATTFAHDLVVQAQQIGQLIGHGPTVGSYREDLLRNLLQRHIPKRFHAATGFIDGSPNQLDILIYDQLEYSPLFRAGDLVVVPPSSVRAIIEVKSTLTSAQLTEALEHLQGAQPVRGDGPPIFTGVFAYDGATVTTLRDGIYDFYRMPDAGEPVDGTVDFHLINDIGEMVDAVCILRKSVLISRFQQTNIDRRGKSLSPQIIELKSKAGRQFQAAIFFDYLSRYLRYPFGGQRADFGIAPIISSDATIGLSQFLYDDQHWGPYFNEEWVEAFEHRVAAFENWLSGEPWVEEESRVAGTASPDSMK